MTGLVFRATIGWVALTSTQAVAGALLPPAAPPSSARGWLLMLSSNALVALVASVVAARTDRRGWQRVLVLFAIVWGVHVNNLVEAVFFPLDVPRSVLPFLFVHPFLATLALVGVLDWLTGPTATGRRVWPEGLRAGSWIARFAACVAVYVVLYLAAGALVWPFVRDFYAARQVPDVTSILVMQLIRGAILTSLLLLMAAHLRTSRAALAMLAGVTLSVLGGITPLMMPNPYLPGAVRAAHLVEVGLSNFLFGWLAALILTRHDGKPESVPRRTS